MDTKLLREEEVAMIGILLVLLCVIDVFVALEARDLALDSLDHCPAKLPAREISEFLKEVQALGKDLEDIENTLSELARAMNSLKSRNSLLIERAQELKNTAESQGDETNSALGTDCADLYRKGFTAEGVYTIKPDAGEKFQVLCVESWVVFQRRLDGSENFYRGFKEYRDGFGDLRGEFWLGLDKINRLTRHGSQKLRIDLQDTSGEVKYAEYDDFSVLSERTGYSLSIGKYKGNAGDSLSYHKNRPFSTKDRDHDQSPDHCAQKHRGAWWYDNCHHSNLNGMYFNGAYTSYADGVVWYLFRGYQYSLRKTQMMFKPTET